MDFELASGLVLPAAERRLLAAGESTRGASPEPEAAKGSATPRTTEAQAGDDKHRLVWKEELGRWICAWS